jgi:vacuolar protein sorting-associated protein 13A/C
VDTSLFIDSLGIVFDEEQYNNLILLLDLFHAYLRQEHYVKLRPPRDVTPKSDPQAWIRYAGNAVLSEIHDKHYRWTWDHFRQRRDDRKAYIPLYVASRLGKASASEKKELEKLERKLSYEDIRFYRSLAKPELRKEKAVMAQKQQNENKKGWFSGWFGKGKQKEVSAEGYGGARELYTDLLVFRMVKMIRCLAMNKSRNCTK